MAKQHRPLTQKEETFVMRVAEGMAASRAYMEAGIYGHRALRRGYGFKNLKKR